MAETGFFNERNTGRKIRFAGFEVDFRQRELRKSGIRIRLQHKPFLILEMLLRQPGTLVTREELARYLWPNLNVSFERGLNTAVNMLRQALGDSSHQFRFIETRPGLGYRFVAPVEEIVDGPVAKARNNGANSDAYQDCLKGQYFLDKQTEDDLRKGMAYFASAIGLDPHCAPAYAGLSAAYSQLALLGAAPAASVAHKAREFALAALNRNPELAEAHVALARVRMLFDWDWNGARAEYLRALELDSEYAGGHRFYAAFLSATESAEEALHESRRAHTLDPLSLPISTELAWHLYASGNFAGAVEQSWKVLTLNPKFAPAQHVLGLAYEQQGMFDEAITELRNAVTCWGDHPAAIGALGHVYALAGMQEQAQEALSALRERAHRRYISGFSFALVNTGLGDVVSALESLERACEERDTHLLWLRVDPRFEVLRSDARSQALLRQLGAQARATSA